MAFDLANNMNVTDRQLDIAAENDSPIINSCNIYFSSLPVFLSAGGLGTDPSAHQA
jgi:hypothetical protein